MRVIGRIGDEGMGMLLVMLDDDFMAVWNENSGLFYPTVELAQSYLSKTLADVDAVSEAGSDALLAVIAAAGDPPPPIPSDELVPRRLI
jgi:hypothetical protein